MRYITEEEEYLSLVFDYESVSFLISSWSDGCLGWGEASSN